MDSDLISGLHLNYSYSRAQFDDTIAKGDKEAEATRIYEEEEEDFGTEKNHEYTNSGYAFGLKALADITMYNNDDLSISVALGPKFQYNKNTLELKLKDGGYGSGTNEYDSDHWSLDAVFGLRFNWNISESLQLRAGLFYETSDLIQFGGSSGKSDKVELTSSSKSSSTTNNRNDYYDYLQDLRDTKAHAVFDSISHNIALEIGLAFNL